jgi:hypothetical protein
MEHDTQGTGYAGISSKFRALICTVLYAGFIVYAGYTEYACYAVYAEYVRYALSRDRIL